MHARGEESLAEILQRVCRNPALNVLINASHHRALREQPHIRKLLQSAAAEAGKSVTFLMSDGAPRTPRAGQTGALLRARRPRYSRSHSPRWMLAQTSRTLHSPFLLAVGAGALLASVVLFVLPRAWITVHVSAEPLVTDVAFFLDTSATIPMAEGGVLPARHLNVEESVEREFPIETFQERGNRAAGSVNLVNATDTVQGIKAGTRLISRTGVVVRIQRGVIVPKQGRVSVPVRADQGGVSGNLSPQRLTIPGLAPSAQSVLFAENATALSGGSTQRVRVLTEEDLFRATQALRADAEARLRAKLQVQQPARERPLGSGALLERSELLRTNVEVLETSPALGAEGEVVRVRARVSAEALTTTLDTLKQFLKDFLRTRAGPQKDITLDGDLHDLRVVSVNWSTRRVELSLHVETTVLPDLLQTELRARLAGQTPESAEELLKGLSGVREATVILSPVWVRRIPGNPRNIHLRRVLDIPVDTPP